MASMWEFDWVGPLKTAGSRVRETQSENKLFQMLQRDTSSIELFIVTQNHCRHTLFSSPFAHGLWCLIVGYRTCESARHSGLLLTAGTQRRGERHGERKRGGGGERVNNAGNTLQIWFQLIKRIVAYRRRWSVKRNGSEGSRERSSERGRDGVRTERRTAPGGRVYLRLTIRRIRDVTQTSLQRPPHVHCICVCVSICWWSCDIIQSSRTTTKCTFLRHYFVVP